MQSLALKRRSVFRRTAEDGILGPRSQPVPINLAFRSNTSEEEREDVELPSLAEDLATKDASNLQDIAITVEAEVDSSDCIVLSKAQHLTTTAPEQLVSVFRKQKQIAAPHLALSLYRRPENAVRLTQCDPQRQLENYFNLHAPECRVLGHGAFSTVRLAVGKRDGKKVAVKSITKHEALRARRLRVRGRRYLEEWEILRQLGGNSYVVSLLDMFESNDEIQLVLEYCQGGELFNAIQKKRNKCMRRGKYSEEQASNIARQLLVALEDIHSRGIVHRDVKPENILLVNSDDCTTQVKLCDFGVARVNPNYDSGSDNEGDVSPITPYLRQSFSIAGSDFYTAPEVKRGGLYDFSVDMYSLGVTVYILLCGFPPVFAGDDMDEVVFPQAYWKDISMVAKEFVKLLLSPDPENRIDSRNAIRHPWIVRGNNSEAQCFTADTLSKQDKDRMELLKERLSTSFRNRAGSPSPRKRGFSEDSTSTTPQKRRRASITLIALADLCRGVSSSPSVAAMTAASLNPPAPSPAECSPSAFVGTTVRSLSKSSFSTIMSA